MQTQTLTSNSAPVIDAVTAAREMLRRREARAGLLGFTRYTMPDYKVNWHHRVICDTLDRFVRGEIKNLMVFMPPQTGKSELVSRRLPAYILGTNPKAKIACVSYSHDLASGFNRDVQRIITTPEYGKVFPDTTLNSSNVKSSAQGSWLRNADMFETVGHGGLYRSVGIGGPLTGKKVDYLFIDDPVKDAVEAKSPSFQLRNWEWWNTVGKSRLHNNSQIIVCQTRWDENDLSGLLLKLRDKGKGLDWHVLSFPAINENGPNEHDPRQAGEVLWEEMHSLARMQEIRDSDPTTFNALYQQDPTPSKEARIYAGWQEIDSIPEGLQVFGGMDFGFSNDPTALVRMAIHNGRMYLDEVVYETGLTNPELAEKIKKAGMGRTRIYADSADPKSIQELQNMGLFVLPALKGADSIRAGINMVKGLKVFVTKRSFNIWNEYKYYQYHLNPDGTPSNEPRDKHNHAQDAIRYGVLTTLTPSVNTKPRSFRL